MEETGEASGHSEDGERPMAPGPMEVSEDDARILGMEASLELTEISATMDTSNPSKKGAPGIIPFRTSSPYSESQDSPSSPSSSVYLPWRGSYVGRYSSGDATLDQTGLFQTKAQSLPPSTAFPQLAGVFRDVLSHGVHGLMEPHWDDWAQEGSALGNSLESIVVIVLVGLLTGQDVGIDLGEVGDDGLAKATAGISRLLALVFESEVRWRSAGELTNLAGMRAWFRSHTTSLATEEEYADAREEGDLGADAGPAVKRDYGMEKEIVMGGKGGGFGKVLIVDGLECAGDVAQRELEESMVMGVEGFGQFLGARAGAGKEPRACVFITRGMHQDIRPGLADRFLAVAHVREAALNAALGRLSFHATPAISSQVLQNAYKRSCQTPHSSHVSPSILPAYIDPSVLRFIRELAVQCRISQEMASPLSARATLGLELAGRGLACCCCDVPNIPNVFECYTTPSHISGIAAAVLLHRIRGIEERSDTSPSERYALRREALLGILRQIPHPR